MAPKGTPISPTPAIINDILFPNLVTIGTAKNRIVYIPTTPEVDINDFSPESMVKGQSNV